MKYEWEDQISEALLQEIDAMLPAGIVLAGIAVWNDEAVEGAIVEAFDLPEGLAGADIAQDILGDAEPIYISAFNSMVDAFEKRLQQVR